MAGLGRVCLNKLNIKAASGRSLMACHTRFRVLLGVFTSVLPLVFPSLAGAETAADFYRGKSFTIVVGSASGGGYDA